MCPFACGRYFFRMYQIPPKGRDYLSPFLVLKHRSSGLNRNRIILSIFVSRLMKDHSMRNKVFPKNIRFFFPTQLCPRRNAAPSRIVAASQLARSMLPVNGEAAFASTPLGAATPLTSRSIPGEESAALCFRAQPPQAEAATGRLRAASFRAAGWRHEPPYAAISNASRHRPRKGKHPRATSVRCADFTTLSPTERRGSALSQVYMPDIVPWAWGTATYPAWQSPSSILRSHRVSLLSFPIFSL